MAQYYNTRPLAIPVQRKRGTGTQDANDDEASEFDKHRETHTLVCLQDGGD